MLPHAPNQALIQQLLALLNGGQAHVTLQAATQDFPTHLHGVTPTGLPYSGWQLLEHLRIAQRDILDFSNPPAAGYQHLDWPKAYWPTSPQPPTPTAWDDSLAAIHADAASFQRLLTHPGADLYTPFPWGDGQNLLREALLLADHNAYHTAELVLLRRLLGCWKS